MSVLLSHVHEAQGGAFMTYDAATGRLQHHVVSRGDAILFHSEKVRLEPALVPARYVTACFVF